ncbi:MULTISPECIES: LexA family protein [Pseudomonas]|nr:MULTISPECIES: LexA family transcriptional regulator [Pseudomonas]
MDTNQLRVEALRRLMGDLSQIDFAEKYDLNASYISQLLTGARSFGERAARNMERKIGLVDGVLSRPAMPGESGQESNVVAAFQPDRYRRYPVISEVQAGEWTDIIEQFHPGDAEEWQGSPKDAGDFGFWLRVTNDSMTSSSGKSFPEGMLVLVNPTLDVMPGNFVVAKLTDSNKATFKQYIEDASGKYLKPLNPSYRMIPINGNCRFVGRVVEAKWADL